MSEEVNQSLIVYISDYGYAYEAMKEAKNAGAKGGTILHGKSSLSSEKSKFFGIKLHTEKDMLLIVCTDTEKDNIMSALIKKYGITTKARGLCFSLKISDSNGFNL
ncbi:MAG: hypothetical protein WC907_07680 [Acholeplasmataceae bacterium]